MTNAELAVLGLVVEQPRHGYQIEQVIEQRNMRRWTDIGFSSIYFLLKKLERQKFIKGEWGKTDRSSERWIKVYRPTKAGREAFHSAIIELLSVPQPRPYPLLLGLRGKKGADLRALGELLVRLSRMALAEPGIREIDLNPIFPFDEGFFIADARIIV